MMLTAAREYSILVPFSRLANRGLAVMAGTGTGECDSTKRRRLDEGDCAMVREDASGDPVGVMELAGS